MKGRECDQRPLRNHHSYRSSPPILPLWLPLAQDLPHFDCLIPRPRSQQAVIGGPCDTPQDAGVGRPESVDGRDKGGYITELFRTAVV